MTFVGNHGVCVTEIQKDGKTYYVCTDGVEFLYDENSGTLLGNDGTEYTIDSKTQKLICNNGNNAYIVNLDGKRVIEFDDGKVYIENSDE